MKLYVMPGSCALACHIALEWANASYELEVLTHDALRGEQFLAVNPKAKVPALKQGWLVQKIPEPTEVTETLGTDAIEQVVPRDHDKRDRRDRPFRQIDEPGEHNRGSTNDPYDPGKEKLEIEGQVPAEANQRELDEDEPKAASEKKPAQLPDASLSSTIKVSRNSGEEDEGRRAEMGDPACQEQRRVGEVAGIWAACAEEIAGMVKRHKHDGQTAQEVDALEALLGHVRRHDSRDF